VTVAESPLKRLLVQTSHYSVASILTMVAGLITFPILTRIFSVADYGLMNLVGATLSVAVAVGKTGIQHSIIRYESEIRAGKGRYTVLQLFSTTTFGMLASSLVVLLAIGIGAQFVPARWLGDARLRGLFAIASLLVVIQVMDSVLVNFLRAEQETATLMKYQVLKKYAGIGIILGTLFLVAQSLKAFYAASIVSEGLAVTLLGWFVFRSGRRPAPRGAQFSRPLYVELLRFGLPMMIGYEISGIVLSIGDRYVIQWTIGATPLGLYSAAYNLCTYVQGAFIASLNQAIIPIYMRMWDTKGAEETSAFINRSLRSYAILGAPLIAGLAAVGPELLTSLASDKYATAVVVLPWVIAGMVVDGTNTMLGAGLFIHRRTRAIMTVVFSSALLNIGLNLALVPRIGIVGSAMATLISYSVTALAMGGAGRRLLPVKVPVMTILRAGACALAMYVPLRNLLPGHHLVTVGVRVALGVPIYGLLMTAIDPDARALVLKALARISRRSQRGGTIE
jgi:O-antigen/teichoic acid export membrane protein